MRGSTRGSSPTGSGAPVIVLDTGALLTWAALSMNAKLVTAKGVLDEVRDERSRMGLDFLLSSGKLEVVEPGGEGLKAALRVARRAGVAGRLSRVDLEVLAVALELAEGEARVAVATDDNALARAASSAGLEVYRIRYRGAGRLRGKG